MITIHVGHVVDQLAAMRAESVHCVVTSPPYWGLRDYQLEPQIWGGEPQCEHLWQDATVVDTRHLPEQAPSPKQASNAGSHQRGIRPADRCLRCDAWRGHLGLEPTISTHIANVVTVFRAVRRVLRTDGTVWLNYGDCYAGSANGRSAADTKAVGNDDRTFRDKPFSTVGDGLKPKDLVMMPARVALALQADGWWVRSDIIWAKLNPMPESIYDRPASAHEHLFLLAKAQRYYYDSVAITEPFADEREGKDGAAQKSERNRGGRIDGLTKPNNIDPSANSGRNRRNVWLIAAAPFPQAHFATFPPALVEPCIKAGTSECGVCSVCGMPWHREVEKTFIPQADVSAELGIRGAGEQKSMDPSSNWQGVPRGVFKNATTGWKAGCACDAAIRPATVLDPFFGAGTTGLVADRLGRDCVGIELSPAYAAMARDRLVKDGGMLMRLTLPSSDVPGLSARIG